MVNSLFNESIVTGRCLHLGLFVHILIFEGQSCINELSNVKSQEFTNRGKLNIWFELFVVDYNSQDLSGCNSTTAKRGLYSGYSMCVLIAQS